VASSSLSRTCIDLVVLDTSGTTVHDDEAVATALVEALGVFGGVAVPDFRDDRVSYVRHTRGISILSVLRSLLGDEARARFAHHAFELALASALAQGGVRPTPGADDTLAALRQTGRRVALMSRFSQRCLDAIVDTLGWRDVVDLAVASGPGVRPPPNPDIVLAALMQLGVAAVGDVAVVGDSANALVAGTRAGASVVAGVLTRAQSLDELERVPHTHLLEDISELPALLDALPARAGAA
jgi:phosphonatase-like hydrolase